MAPSRRTTNGRSPLVNQQRQITSFFSKNASSSPTVSPSPSPSLVKQNPNIDSSPSPLTPLPLETKRKKPLLVIGPSSFSSPSTPATSSKVSYGPEVVDRRIKVYWPLDKVWYEGCVKHFDKVSGMHLVLYDDDEDEMLNLAAEKIEWSDYQPVKNFRRRLRRISVVEDDEETEGEEKQKEGNSEGDGDDDSADEDWGKNAQTEAIEDVSGDMDLEDEDDDGVCCGKASGRSKKRKMSGAGKQLSSNSTNKRKNIGDTKQNARKVPFDVDERKLIEPATNIVNSKRFSSNLFRSLRI